MSNPATTSAVNIDELRRKLVKKVRLQRGVHDVFEGRTRTLLKIQKSINVVVTAFITLIVFADFGLLTKILPSYSGLPASITVGIISFILFVINALADVFGLSSRNSEHLRSIQLYTDLLRDIKNTAVAGYDDTTALEVLNQLNDRYMQISVSSFNVGGRNFSVGENIYYKRRALRLAAKEAPFSFWWERRKRAQELVKTLNDREKLSNI